LFVEWVMRVRNFRELREVVRRQVLGSSTVQVHEAEKICHAIDLACVFYFKPVLCLQRSAVATILLRRYGYPAELVIGVQVAPSRSHAWVEVDGVVVNDRHYMRALYRVLERC
jgi:hypothetical protein